MYRKHFAATAFLENYMSRDVAIVKLGASSGTGWMISVPERDVIIEELKSRKYNVVLTCSTCPQFL